MKSALTILSVLFSVTAATAFMAPGDPTLESALQAKGVGAASPAGDAVLFLKFQNHQSDYLIFYDADGSTLLLRYRRDRWYYDNDDLRDSLRQGITYRVVVKQLARVEEGKIPAGISGAGLPRVPVVRKIRKVRELYIGDIAGINESALRDLRY